MPVFPPKSESSCASASTSATFISDGEDVFGDGVNVAARLQEFAQPGGIVVSNTVVIYARNKVAHGFVALGERRVTLADIGLAHLLTGEFEEAVRLCERSIAERRENGRAWQRLAAALGHLGRLEAAERALAKVFELQPDFGSAYVHATYPFREPAHAATFSEGLRKAGWSG